MLWCSLVVSMKAYAKVLIGCVYESLCCGAHWLCLRKFMLWCSLVVSMKAYAVVLISCVYESLCCGAHWLCL